MKVRCQDDQAAFYHDLKASITKQVGLIIPSHASQLHLDVIFTKATSGTDLYTKTNGAFFTTSYVRSPLSSTFSWTAEENSRGNSTKAKKEEIKK